MCAAQFCAKGCFEKGAKKNQLACNQILSSVSEVYWTMDQVNIFKIRYYGPECHCFSTHHWIQTNSFQKSIWWSVKKTRNSGWNFWCTCRENRSDEHLREQYLKKVKTERSHRARGKMWGYPCEDVPCTRYSIPEKRAWWLLGIGLKEGRRVACTEDPVTSLNLDHIRKRREQVKEGKQKDLQRTRQGQGNDSLE